MLPVGVALRLSRAVSEAAERSGAEERRLREELRELQRLLPPRKPRAAEILGKDGVTASGTEDSSEISEQVCGGGELQELELLNKALAKALRIRQTHKVLETELIQPGAPEGSTTVTDGGRGTVRQSAVARCHDQRSPTIPHGSASAKADKVGARMASSSCPAGGLSGKRTTPHTVSSRKPAAGTLKAPYKTELVGRRRSVSSTAGRLARGSLRSGSRADGTAATQHPDHGVPVHRAGSRTQCSIPHSLKPTPRTFRDHKVRTPAGPDTSSTPTFVPVSQQNMKSIKESVKSSASKEGMLQSDPSGVETPKLFILQSSGLWGKVSKNKADAVQERRRFMERIQSAFHSQLPSVSSAEIEEQLDRISDLYRCINQYLYTDPLLHSMDPYGGQQEREREQTLERCQETLPSLLQHIQQLKDAATLWMKLGSCWRPAFKACRDSGSGCAPLLLYSSLQELKEMDTLRFHVQTLQQQIHIQRVMAEELLPVVFSSESPEQPQFHLYRAAYSLLCEGGEQFPVLVLDNIPD